MNFNVVIAGAGVLGSQIAFHAAYSGIPVTVWLRSEESVKRAKARFIDLTAKYMKSIYAFKEGKLNYIGALYDMLPEYKESDYDSMVARVNNAGNFITFETDFNKAFVDKNFVIESITEDAKLKAEFYTKLNDVISDNAVITTNTSTFVPSDFVRFIKKPERFIAMHYANNIYLANIVEIMGSSVTNEDTKNTALDFADKLRMYPSIVNKETRGYILNSMLVPFIVSALTLWGSDVASPHDIDNTWRLSTSSKYGPFQIIDLVGANTVCAIASNMKRAEDDPVSIAVRRLKEMSKENKKFY